MSDTTNALNDLASLLKAGESYYRDGAKSIDDRNISTVFAEMAAVRSAAIAELSHKIEALDEEPAGASWMEQARQFYTNAKNLFAKDRETMINALEEHEDRTLKQIKEALDDVEDREAAAILLRHLRARPEIS